MNKSTVEKQGFARYYDYTLMYAPETVYNISSCGMLPNKLL